MALRAGISALLPNNVRACLDLGMYAWLAEAVTVGGGVGSVSRFLLTQGGFFYGHGTIDRYYDRVHDRILAKDLARVVTVARVLLSHPVFPLRNALYAAGCWLRAFVGVGARALGSPSG